MAHRKLDPYSRARDAARELARADPRNKRLHEARSLLEYLPAIAVYPLRLEVLLTLVVLAFGLWLGFATIGGIWLGVFFVAAAIVYWLEIVGVTALGFGAPPRFAAAAFGRLGDSLRVIIPLGCVSALVWFGAARDQPLLHFGGIALGAVALPAILVVVAVEGDLFAALDPRRWLRFVVDGGVAYWAVMATAGYLVSRVAEVGVPTDAADVITNVERFTAYADRLVMLYLAFAAAHLLGAAVFLRREALGFQAVLQGKGEAEVSAESLQESVARLLALADEEEHHGRHEQAVRLLATEPFAGHPPRQWLEELFEGACRRPKPYFAEAAGQRLVAHLVGAQQWARALEVVVLAAQRWPRFQPAALDQRVALAQQALERRAALAFRQLTERLEELGAAPQAVDLAFLVARWRAEREDDAAGALQALAPLLERKEHPAHRRIAALDAALRGGRKA